jgi:hypothetical protein
MISGSDLISKFIDATDQYEQYNAISVLASFKNTENNNEILKVFKTSKFDTIGGRIACAFLLKYRSEADKKVKKRRGFSLDYRRCCECIIRLFYKP